MINLSRGQEREERNKLKKGLLVSIFGLIFAWVPVLGLLLAIVGFLTVFVRVTEKYRARRVAYVIVTLLILILSTGVLACEVYAYVENPNVLSEVGMWTFKKLTGREALPGAPDESYMEGIDYEAGSAGMGYDPALYEEFDEGDADAWPEGEDDAPIEGDQDDWEDMDEEGDQGNTDGVGPGLTFKTLPPIGRP